LQFFRLKPYKTAEFKVAVPKTEVLEQPHLILMYGYSKTGGAE
jgi:hypothetical protein